ncbi:AAA domain-containing protein [Actinomadura sp. DSM 109109]|nr:AAA domain-containing protein [Actinomadura lepetitiana]
MSSRSELRSEMLFTAVRLLADSPSGAADAGIPYRELHDRVLETSPDLKGRWQEIAGDTWYDASYLELQFASIGLVKAGWLHKSRRRWFPTGLGRSAPAACPDPASLSAELDRIYAYWERHKESFQMAMAMAEVLPEGRWASVADVASETGLETAALVGLLLGNRPEGWHRLLSDDGTLPREARATESERARWLRMLEEEGTATLIGGGADAHHRMGAVELRLLVGTPGPDPVDPRRRAWLVRSSDLTGLWLDEEVCSLPAERLRDLPPGSPLDRIAVAVRDDYAEKSVQDRDRLTVQFHVFLSRMKEHDIVVTNEGSRIYLGEITGGPSFVSSVGDRANLQRPVRWHDTDRNLDYDDLPDEFSDLVSNPDADIVDLTSLRPELEKLLGEPVAVVERTMVLPEAGDDLADKLLVDREWLEECVTLLRERPQLIFYGPPGTGKTHLAREIAKHLAGGRPECVQLVQFHPAYAYEDFFEGYRPRKADDGTVTFDLVRGPFRRLVSAALSHPGRPYVLIIDEINRGNLAKIFGELYFLLEYRNDPVNLLYGSGDDKGFRLPPNVIVIGTMNTADRSIALVDAAMRRRFWFVELHPDTPPTRDMLARWLGKRELPDEPARLLAELNSRIEDRDYRVGPSYLMRESAATEAGLARIWRTQILPLLEEHHYGDGTDVQARYGLDALRSRPR